MLSGKLVLFVAGVFFLLGQAMASYCPTCTNVPILNYAMTNGNIGGQLDTTYSGGNGNVAGASLTGGQGILTDGTLGNVLNPIPLSNNVGWLLSNASPPSNPLEITFTFTQTQLIDRVSIRSTSQGAPLDVEILNGAGQRFFFDTVTLVNGNMDIVVPEQFFTTVAVVRFHFRTVNTPIYISEISFTVCGNMRSTNTPIDDNTWVVDPDGESTGGTWTIEANGLQWHQSTNLNCIGLYSIDPRFQGYGTYYFELLTNNADDDFFGFYLDYRQGGGYYRIEYDNAMGNTPPNTPGRTPGFTLVWVPVYGTGNDNCVRSNFQELAGGLAHGQIPYVRNRWYSLAVQYTTDSIILWMEDPNQSGVWTLELSADLTTAPKPAAQGSGSFAYFTDSQPDCYFRNLRQTTQSVTCAPGNNNVIVDVPFNLPSTCGTLSASMDWGDGTAPTVLSLNGPAQYRGTHNYQFPGVYRARARIQSTVGLTDTEEIIVFVACPQCGNGFLEVNEACEGNQLRGLTCATQSFQSGTLGCNPTTCALDTSGCAVCGDGSITGNEVCDGAQLGGVSCLSLGFTSGTLTCNAAGGANQCTFNTAGCGICGNSIVDGSENCDGFNLNGATCISRGFPFGGTLACGGSCLFDTSGCAFCGDNVREGTEECDGIDFDGQTCGSRGFSGGSLTCNPTTCLIETASCFSCGDGALNGNEECDGNLFPGSSTCASQGFTSGVLSCSSSCELDTSTCGLCGNGIREATEACDVNDIPDSETCVSNFFTNGGIIGCTTSCTIDTSDCAFCGDGLVEGNEQCDPGTTGIPDDLSGESCESLGFPGGGVLSCDAVTCIFDTDGCASCGNGQREADEQCDGGALGGETCQSLGYDSGDLGCVATCEFDFTGCGTCGNRIIDGFENCEGDDLRGEDCVGQGFPFGGTLGCHNCFYETSECADCGDNVREGTEECDGTDLNDDSCESLGFSLSGTLACNGCQYDTTDCAVCGDGKLTGASLNGEEVCDGGLLGGETCQSQGFPHGGVLHCSSICTEFDTSDCAVCGDHVVEGNEDCDGPNLNGQLCETIGGGDVFDSGTLRCSSDCDFDVSTCGKCGNDIIDGEERCDGIHLGKNTCESVGFPFGGVLGCTNCVFNTSGCALCGDEVIEFGEQCDGSNLGGNTCVTRGYTGGSLSCFFCAFDYRNCSTCGNNIIEAEEECDGFNLGGVTCLSRGFTGGSISCNRKCKLDTSLCLTCEVDATGRCVVPVEPLSSAASHFTVGVVSVLVMLLSVLFAF